MQWTQQKKYKDIPEDLRASIRDTELSLLATSSEIKQTIKASYQTGASVPKDLRKLYAAFTDAMQYKSIAPVLLDALNKPACIIIHNGQTTEDKDSIEQYAIHFIITFKMLPAETRQIVRDALINPDLREHLPISEYYILANTLVMLQTATHHASEIQSIFYLTPAEINAAITEARALDYIAIPIDEDINAGTNPQQQSLPGLEAAQPPAHRYPAPPYIYTPTTIIPTAELARNIHNLPLQPTINGAGVIAEIGVDARPHTHYVYMLMLDALEREYPIQPIDKTILIALGNLYGERKRAGATGIQDGAIITAEDVIKRYRGLESTADVTQELIDAVTARMDALSKMRVAFDFTQHFEYRRKHIGDGVEVELDIPDDLRQIDSKTGTVIRFSYNGNMIHANTIEVEYSTGRVARAWEILRPPIVFDYAQKIKQVATIETKLLDLRTKANSSKNADIMKFYLIERINAMIDPRTHQPKPDFSQSIMLDSVFEAMRIDINNRKTKKQKVDTIKNILEHFKTTQDKHRGTFIKDFCEIKGYRGALMGFDVFF